MAVSGSPGAVDALGSGVGPDDPPPHPATTPARITGTTRRTRAERAERNVKMSEQYGSAARVSAERPAGGAPVLITHRSYHSVRRATTAVAPLQSRHGLRPHVRRARVRPHGRASRHQQHDGAP